MKSLVIYESMYGNTHRIAMAIADGLSEAGEALVLGFDQVVAASLEGVDLVVVGAPTHAHGLSRPSTRKAAADAAQDPDKGLSLDTHDVESGLREWFEGIGHISARGAAFDTRVDMAALLTGSAARGIAKRLRRHGCVMATDPESFLVDKSNHLLTGEEDRARRWGAGLVRLLGSGDLVGAV